MTKNFNEIDAALLSALVDISKLPRSMANDICQYQNENYSATKGDILTVREAIDYYLTWNGIINYTDLLFYMFVSIVNEGKRNAQIKQKDVLRVNTSVGVELQPQGPYR